MDGALAQSSTIGGALAAYRAANAIPQDDAERTSWTCKLGRWTLRLPNFAWRRRAVLAHDLHHLATGYPCSLKGECQIAAWEFAAGPMPHWVASLFCSPLIPLGFIWAPWQTWRAFRDGRRCCSLHGQPLGADVLAAPLASLSLSLSLSDEREGRDNLLHDALLFALLVGRGTAAILLSLVLAMLPFAALWWAMA